MTNSDEAEKRIGKRILEVEDLLSEANEKLQHIIGQLMDMEKKEPQPVTRMDGWGS